MTAPPRLVYLLNSAQRRLQQWIGAQHAQAGMADGPAPSAAQGGVLFVLGQSDGLTMGQLAELLDLAPSAMSGLVQRLEAQDWVQRQPCPQDARTQRVWLRPQGRAQLPALKAGLKRLNARLRDGFTDDELAVVARWLTHVQQLHQSQD